MIGPDGNLLSLEGLTGVKVSLTVFDRLHVFKLYCVHLCIKVALPETDPLPFHACRETEDHLDLLDPL